MIHVAYGLHDKTGRYSKFTGTAILSMFENISQPPPAITVHILHDNTLTQDNRDKFIYLADRYNQIIKFYNVEEIFPNLISMIPESMHNRILSPRFTAGTLYRLILDRILPEDIEKIIYLDSDIVINLDISELWQVELGNRPIAAVTLFDNMIENNRNEPLKSNILCGTGIVRIEDYLNDGVLLINLKKFRAEDSLLNWGVNHVPKEYMQFADGSQQYFNICFSSQSLKLPTKFNTFVYYVRDGALKNISRRIYHYVEGNIYRGLRLDTTDVFSKLFFKYFIKTPFFDEDTLGNIFDGFKQIYVERQNFSIEMSAIISGKSRAFVTMSQNVEAMKKIFYVSESEEIFQIDSQDWFPKLVNTMKESFGKKIFIILAVGMYPQLGAALTQAGFLEGRDFINGEIFLSEMHGVPLNLYPLIMRM